MKKLSAVTLLLFCIVFLPEKNLYSQNIPLHQLFDNYYEARLKLFPLEATEIGDSRYNNLLPNDGSEAYRHQLNQFYDHYLRQLKNYKKQDLNKEDRTSYDLLNYFLKTSKESLTYHPEYMPANQYNSLPLTMAKIGSGSATQPFKTVADYNHWLRRMEGFKTWVDTAIGNFNKGVKAHVVLPKALVLKMILQMQKLAEPDTSKNIFYGPVRNFPESFTDAEKEKLRYEYHTSIQKNLTASYLKLADYLKNDYLPHARTTTGYNALPGGNANYKFQVRLHTTTNKSPEEICRIGVNEVDRIHKQMEEVKTETGFKGSLPDFFHYLNTDPKFHPFKTDEEILNAYRSVQARIEPNLDKLFGIKPKGLFEIRQTEAFRAATTAAQYYVGTADGKRPGIFYVPIVNPANYPFFTVEDLFMHEAIPGHHYQLSLQAENTSLPRFRKNIYFNAFGEGWGLYAETLGKPLGVYTDPYQYLGFLQNQIHRAIRLVVDVAMHTGKMTREEAIKYTTDNEPVTEQYATSEIERYMAWPGQALSYKIGELKIEELRDKYKKLLGNKFSIRDFHDAVLKGGCLPLTVFESYMDDWAGRHD